MFSRLRTFFIAVSRRRRVETEMDAELRFHIESYAEDLARSGVPRAEAERRARIEFGGAAAVKEECRESLGLRLFDEFRQDLRYAVRSLRKSRGFTAAALASLALGIGANTLIFTFVNVAYLKPYAYHNAHELVRLFRITERNSLMQMMGISPAGLQELVASTPVLSGVAAITNVAQNASFQAENGRGAASVMAASVTANYFRVFGVRPAMGADFPSDANRPGLSEVALVTNRFWRERLAADPLIPGQSAVMNGKRYRITGVLPADPFDRTLYDIWVPASLGPKEWNSNWGFPWGVAARLRPGVTLEQANGALKPLGIAAQPYQTTWESREPRLLLLIAFGAAGLVLLIACVNVANLMLARSAARRQEVAIRLSIGAGRLRVARQLLTESLLLALAGGAAGAALAAAALPLVKRVVSVGGTRAVLPLPYEASLALDWRVLLFAVGASLFVGGLFGLAPAWQLSKPPAPRLAGRQRRNSGRAALLVAETALAVVIAAGAGLMTHSFARILAVDPGYDPDGILTWSVPLPPEWRAGPSNRAYQQRFLDGLRRVPDIEAASSGNATPFASFDGPVYCGGDRVASAFYWMVTPEYARVTRLRMVSGRWLAPSDIAGSTPVVVIDPAVARKCFGTENPLGRTIRILTMKDTPLVVVGVAGAVKENGVTSKITWAGIYVSQAQIPDKALPREPVFMVRTRGNPISVAPAVRAVAASLDRNVEVRALKTMNALLADDVQVPRFRAALFGLFGFLALALAAAGVYGVTHYAVAQRTHEIGIRMALGARRGNVIAMVLHQSLGSVLAGLALGMGASLMLTRLLKSMLFEIQPRDPATLTAVAVAVLFAAIAAALFPARRAAAIEPVVTLRHE